jgi:hypothetical protein
VAGLFAFLAQPEVTRMSLTDTFKSLFRRAEIDPLTAVMLDTFRAANESYSIALNETETFTQRAHNRCAFRRAFRAYRDAPPGDNESWLAYQEALAKYNDPADREEYTEVYLNAHTECIEALAATFAAVVTSFSPSRFDPPTDVAQSYCLRQADFVAFKINDISSASTAGKIGAHGCISSVAISGARHHRVFGGVVYWSSSAILPHLTSPVFPNRDSKDNT